jgi:hypothetical protein
LRADCNSPTVSQHSRNLSWVTYDDLMADLPQARWIAEQIKIDGTTRVAAARMSGT